MKKGTLTRFQTSDQGTFGRLVLESGFACATLELPWRDNKKDESCIPEGTYLFKKREGSPKHGTVYEMVLDSEAPNREHVQIHAANLGGDVKVGFVKQLEGCIAPGMKVSIFQAGVKPAGEKAQQGVTESVKTLKLLIANLDWEDFELKIEAEWHKNV